MGVVSCCLWNFGWVGFICLLFVVVFWGFFVRGWRKEVVGELSFSVCFRFLVWDLFGCSWGRKVFILCFVVCMKLFYVFFL